MYGEEFKVDGNVYLIEKNDNHVFVSQKEDDESYTSIFEGDYTSCFWDEELEQLKKLDYETGLYAILCKCLDWTGRINSLASYQRYLFRMLEDGHTKREILSSDSDEILVYATYFPLDIETLEFKKLSSSIIERKWSEY